MRMSPVTRVLLLALATGVVVDVAVPGNAIGLNAPLVIGALCAAALVAAGPAGLRRMDLADAWLAPGALVLAGFGAVRADAWLVEADLAFAVALAAGAIAALGGARITRGVVPHVLDVALGVTGAAVAGVLGLVGPARLTTRPEEAADGGPATGGPGTDGEAGTRAGAPSRARAAVRCALARSAPVLRGLALAVPLLLVFAVLFALADAVFARVAGDILAWRPDLDLGAAAGHGAVVGGATWIAAGLLALGAGLLPSFLPSRSPGSGRGSSTSRDATAAEAAVPGRSLGAASIADLPVAGRPRLGTTEAATALLVVDLLFAAFVGLQLAYLFGGQDTLAAAGLTYAEYARRGFFELVAVAILAGILALTLDAAIGRRSRAQLVAALVLMALTAVVLVSALVRLRLYQEAYGWTELRFTVLVAIVWLGVALALVCGLLATRRTGWTLHVLGIALLVALVGMNVVGPQAFVAERNLERALDPALVPDGGRTGLDTAYLWELGDEAVPAVIAALPRLDPGDRAMLTPVLRERAITLATDAQYAGWQSWNMARERARAALAAWTGSR